MHGDAQANAIRRTLAPLRAPAAKRYLWTVARDLRPGTKTMSMKITPLLFAIAACAAVVAMVVTAPAHAQPPEAVAQR